MNSDTEKKVVDILSDHLKDALKSIDLSITVAFTCVVFLLLHGLQGDFAREAKRQAPASAQIANATNSNTTFEKPAEEQKTTIPFFGFEANVLAAGLMALTLYWVFCIRAAVRCSRAADIAKQLAEKSDDIHTAVLSFPSSATARRGAKAALCLVLGALAYGAYVVMFLSSTTTSKDAIYLGGIFAAGAPPVLLWFYMRLVPDHLGAPPLKRASNA